MLIATFDANAQTFSAVPIWSDEFIGENILPEPTVWNNEIGMIRNAELQYYTDRDIDNQVIRNGNLEIIGLKENFGGARYTSSSLTSKSYWKYGKIEANIKMQTGMGIWGCFWTLGKKMSWPSSGEIDIIEHINSQANYHTTAHWWNESLTSSYKHQADGGDAPNPIGNYNANNYNKYGIEWTPSYIKWFVNDICVKTMSILNGTRGTWEFHAPQYILLNCPIGGQWPQIDAGSSWNEALIPTPNTMYVDYVKVYSYNSQAPLPPTGLISSSVTQTAFTINWTASAGATAYDVVVDNNGTISTYGPFSTSTCSIAGLVANTNYAVRVKARNTTTNNSDFSELSDPLYVTTSATNPPTPIVNIQFNENTGTSTANTGMIGGSLNIKGTANWSSNIPENSSVRTSAISIANDADCVETPYLVDQLKGLNDLTITGWLNCKDATETGGNRIVNCLGSQWFDATIGTGGFDLVYKTDGSLQLGINEAVGTTSARSSASKITTDAAAGASNWKFFAVTYSASSQSVSFYFGTTATNATLDKTVTYNRGVVGNNMDPLAIGNFNSVTRGWLKGRMFRGLIDQIQIYNSSLNLSQVVAIQNVGNPIFVTNISVTPLIVNLNAIGSNSQLVATIAPDTATNKTVNWTSSNINVVSVDKFGLVTAVGPGIATITATTEDGNFTSTATIKVILVLENVYEAESGSINGGTALPLTVKKTSLNASGGKVVSEFTSLNSFNRISTINAGGGGRANLIIRYSNGTGVNQSLTYHDYGSPVTVRQVVFPPTANWDTFAEITISIELSAGANQSIKFQKLSTDIAGVGPDIDKYTVSFVNWTGANSTAYETATNWFNNEVPPASSIIYIPAGLINYPVINANQTIAGGFIATGASLSLTEGKVLTNNGTLTNNGDLILKSSATGTASLLSASSVNNVSQQRYLSSNQRGWRLLSNPLANTTFSALAATSNITLGTNYTGAYNSASNSWTITDGSAAMDTNKAYKVFITGQTGEAPSYTSDPTNVTLVNKGTAANTVPASVVTTAGQYYLVANPYTAPVSVSAIISASTGLSNTVSYYNPSKSATDTKIKAGGYDFPIVGGIAGSSTDVLIPPMGALFVQANSAGTINVPKTAIFIGIPAATSGNYTHKTNQTDTSATSALTIDVANNGVNYDRLQLRFKEVGITGSNIDFGKLPNTFLDFYSIDNSKNMAVSELELKEQTIPLGITSTVLKTFTFKVAENTIPTGFEAVLVDNALHTKTVLAPGANYSFAIDNTPVSQGNARFAINLKTAGALSLADAVFDSQIQVWPNPARNQFNILNAQSQNEGVSTIVVSSLNGQVIHSQKSDPGTTITIQTNGWASGVYTLKATNNGTQTVKKLIISN